MVGVKDQQSGGETEPDLLDKIDSEHGVYIYTPELGVALAAMGFLRSVKTKVRRLFGKGN